MYLLIHCVLNSVTVVSSTECVKAYNETSPSTVACKVGCKSQEAMTEEEKKKVRFIYIQYYRL